MRGTGFQLRASDSSSPTRHTSRGNTTHMAAAASAPIAATAAERCNGGWVDQLLGRKSWPAAGRLPRKRESERGRERERHTQKLKNEYKSTLFFAGSLSSKQLYWPNCTKFSFPPTKMCSDCAEIEKHHNKNNANNNNTNPQ